jgi:hypothetical protein
MNKSQFAKLANDCIKGKNYAEQHSLIKEALEFLVKEFNIEFGDFKVYVRQGKISDRVEINKSLQIDLKTH